MLAAAGSGDLLTAVAARCRCQLEQLIAGARELDMDEVRRPWPNAAGPLRPQVREPRAAAAPARPASSAGCTTGAPAARTAFTAPARRRPGIGPPRGEWSSARDGTCGSRGSIPPRVFSAARHEPWSGARELVRVMGYVLTGEVQSLRQDDMARLRTPCGRGHVPRPGQCPLQLPAARVAPLALQLPAPVALIAGAAG